MPAAWANPGDRHVVGSTVMRQMVDIARGAGGTLPEIDVVVEAMAIEMGGGDAAAYLAGHGPIRNDWITRQVRAWVRAHAPEDFGEMARQGRNSVPNVVTPDQWVKLELIRGAERHLATSLPSAQRLRDVGAHLKANDARLLEVGVGLTALHGHSLTPRHVVLRVVDGASDDVDDVLAESRQLSLQLGRAGQVVTVCSPRMIGFPSALADFGADEVDALATGAMRDAGMLGDAPREVALLLERRTDAGVAGRALVSDHASGLSTVVGCGCIVEADTEELPFGLAAGHDQGGRFQVIRLPDVDAHAPPRTIWVPDYLPCRATGGDAPTHDALDFDGVVGAILADPHHARPLPSPRVAHRLPLPPAGRPGSAARPLR